MSCIRCGRTENIENHHIVQRIDGGSDEPENKEPLCNHCHNYEHAKRNILVTLEKERKRRQSKRVAILEHRLEVLEELNSPELIRERGHYQTYWIDETTHDYPRYEKVGIEIEEKYCEIAATRLSQSVMKL